LMRKSQQVSRIAHCAALLFAAQIGREALAQGSVTGRVTDREQTAIARAEVEIAAIGARTRTDSAGRFQFSSVPPGLHRIDVRRLGFTPASIEVGVRADESVSVQVLLVRAQILPAVPVEGIQPSATNYRLKDFERRRSSGVGQFLTTVDLAPERSKPLGDVLVRLRGVYVVRSELAACLTTTRGAQSLHNAVAGYCGNRSIGAAYCPVAVFVDGSPSYTGHSEEVFNLNSLRADEVAGVEFYSGSSTVPREFGAPRGTCGVVVIWRKN
jgi:Carboxypeptidase regulatory-like domain